VTTQLRCPGCLGELAAQADGFACPSCARTYPQREGIADFRWHRHDYYFNPVPRDEMSRLNADAPNVPWEASVRHFLRFVKNVPDWIDNIAINGRYAWKLFLELPPSARMLDFGCGLGNLTQNVAPHVAETVALDLTWERLQFARERFARFNARDRITLIAGGDGPHLPFADAYFDCIALSGVLEWIADDADGYGDGTSRIGKVVAMLASFFGETNPRRTQLRFLRELRRILKPDGQLFVGIENRWGYEYFLGRPDHHSGLWLGSLLPRFAANAYSIARSRRPYRTYTHTYRGMRRLFAHAGMPRYELYGLSPGYSQLSEILPAHTEQPFWNPVAPADLAQRLKRSRYFVPAFGMIAQAHGARRLSLAGRLLAHIEAEAQLGKLQIRACRISGKDKIVLDVADGDQALIVKLPADAASHAGEANNARTLQSLERRAIHDVPSPRVVTNGSFQGIAYYVERAVAGVPLAQVGRSIDRRAFAAKVANLIRAFSATQGEAMSQAAKGALCRRIAIETCAKLRQAGMPGATCEALSRRAQAAFDAPWRLGLCHGDLSVHNLFVSGGEIAGVIDWEYALEHGIAALDLIGYLESRQRLDDPASTVSTNLLRLAHREWPCKEELDVVGEFYAHYGIDDAQHESLCLLAWLSHMGHQLDGPARFDPRFAERLVVPQIGALVDPLFAGAPQSAYP
jgi:SAM-dependent methyltransferase/aminoglycoside phosphotransferase (APT) family kinase protein